jgi:CheY-like chemotaxis protein
VAHILVADDNRGFAELVRAMLEDDGHTVVTCYSGLAALAAAEGDEFDLAVLDVLIPQVSGDAVAERLRQEPRPLPILLVTGADQSFASATGLSVLRKPFAKDELLAEVRRLIG